ncbi:probable tRNA N6-adenosine threonylcarbamoyltransferase, mitochondrial isoform X3 [Nasonia vitripennis]|uniref:N(6)-L-threonylcarbamoyladenine synthase n=1 Tax=Nasonia vitripennis TaxID=7425 RepID=A0A7M7QLB2_NASVI|nr:probable tRNA N6-adenosine threonylcarbamoyltransferase, mitochondrial isoform X3 [Nasonia vitripennis]
MHQLRTLLRSSKLFFELLHRNPNSHFLRRKNFSTNDRPAVILGIETSCDDTGIAIVDSTGKVLGEAHNSQITFHLPLGGINPPNARALHLQNIQSVYEECLRSADLKLSDVDAIAVTVEPGLPLSLIVGRDFALNLSRVADKPLIPIHHMKAHALTARMTQKVARRLKLMNILEYSEISGGEAIELAARKADNPDQFNFPGILMSYRDCNFSFSGLKNIARRHIMDQEETHNIKLDAIIPDVNNLCAGFLISMTRHLCHRAQRAMEFVLKKELFPEDNRTFVVSGGVASNNFIANALNKVCQETEFRFVRPPPRLCSDNGIMIAWNGVEKYLTNSGVLRDRNEIDKVDIAHRSPIGEDWRKIVLDEGIKRKWVKLKFNELIDR